jgi:hypothetical protein
VREFWLVVLRGEGGANVLGGTSTRARLGEPSDSFCVFSSRRAAKTLVRIGQTKFDFLRTALRGAPAEEVDYISLRPEAIATFAEEMGMPYVMPNPTPHLFFRDGVVPTVPVEKFSASP